MDFPNMIYGDYGDEKVISVGTITHLAGGTTRTGYLPLGTRMVLPDGRMYAYARAGGTTLARGLLCQGKNTTDNHDTNQAVQAAAAVGSQSIVVTLGDAALTLNYYRDGYVVVNNATTPAGQLYKIAECSSAAASGTPTITFEGGDTLHTAFEATTTEVGLRTNEFDGCNLWEAGTVECMIAGIPTREITADYYFWVQRRGAAGYKVKTSATLGLSLMASTGSDGSLIVWAGSAAATTFEVEPVGYCMTVQSDGDYGLVYLTLD